MNHLSQEGGVTLDAEEINVPNSSMPAIQQSDRRDELLKVHHAQTHRQKQAVTRCPPKGEGKGVSQNPAPQGRLQGHVPPSAD